jgi:glycogen(starch) synthase
MGKEKTHLFEVSWEVCNKVGGINTVLASKAPYLVKHFKDSYCLIGPYFPENAVAEFQEKIPPDRLHHIFEKLHKEGIVCHYGQWLINDKPCTILVDYTGYAGENNDIKARLWETYRIDSLGTAFHDFDEPILWGHAVGRLLEEISESYKKERIVAQFHEWLSCGALLYLKMHDVQIGTIFTTHATMLGRTLAGNNVDLYSQLAQIDPEEEARKWNITAKHHVERASAHACDVFSTVSEITGIEAEHFLKKKPDILLFNGIDLKNRPSFDELAVKHRLYREKIKNFLQYYFFPYYSFELDNTLLYFISGRYEFHNKGLDIFIEALGKLNQRLKDSRSKKTVVVFFWVPADAVRIRPSISRARAYYYDIWDSINDDIQNLKKRLVMCLISQTPITDSRLFSKEFIDETTKKVLRFVAQGNPPLSTHDLRNEENDPMTQGFKAEGLLNRKEDRVKVIIYPIYLTGADNLLDITYDEAVIGSHLGVFPSYYEPWGYTPLETAALGVASVTTDFAGFGRYLKQDSARENTGIFIIDMFGKNHKSKVDNLFDTIYRFTGFDSEERVRNKVEAQRLATLVDWEILIHNYLKAYQMAADKAYP